MKMMEKRKVQASSGSRTNSFILPSITKELDYDEKERRTPEEQIK